MDEEKTIDEAVEEQADEMKEFEPIAFDEVIKEEPAKESAPVLRALGDPDPANMDMIHKHLDNFLAMLCGETPIDDNVRNSTEYWLKRLADGLGGSTKKIYTHYVSIVKTSGTHVYTIQFIILNGDETPYTFTTFKNWLDTHTTENPVRLFTTGAVFVTGDGLYIPSYYYQGGATRVFSSLKSNGTYAALNVDWDIYGVDATFYDGVTPIN